MPWNPVLSNWQSLYHCPTETEVAFEPWVASLGRPYRFQHIMLGNIIADFCLIQDKVVIELDGSSHTKKSQKEKDKLRTERLYKAGYTVVRAWNYEATRWPRGTLNLMMERAGLPYRVPEDFHPDQAVVCSGTRAIGTSPLIRIQSPLDVPGTLAAPEDLGTPEYLTAESVVRPKRPRKSRTSQHKLGT